MPLKQRFHPASRQPNSGLPRHCDCRTVCEYSAVRDHCGRGYPRAPDAGQSAAVILKRHPDRFESPRLASSPSKSPRPWRPPIQALEYSQQFRLSPPGGVIASAGTRRRTPTPPRPPPQPDAARVPPPCAPRSRRHTRPRARRNDRLELPRWDDTRGGVGRSEPTPGHTKRLAGRLGPRTELPRRRGRKNRKAKGMAPKRSQ